MPATTIVVAPLAAPIPRTAISIGLAPDLRPRLAALAHGRSLVIDYVASRCCTSVAIGDLTVRWEQQIPGPGFVELAPIEGVPMFVEQRLLGLLTSAGPTIQLEAVDEVADRLPIGSSDPEEGSPGLGFGEAAGLAALAMTSDRMADDEPGPARHERAIVGVTLDEAGHQAREVGRVHRPPVEATQVPLCASRPRRPGFRARFPGGAALAPDVATERGPVAHDLPLRRRRRRRIERSPGDRDDRVDRGRIGFSTAGAPLSLLVGVPTADGRPALAGARCRGAPGVG